jgi:hypothetical protein
MGACLVLTSMIQTYCVSNSYFDLDDRYQTKTNQGAFEILVSTPERAFMECVTLVPKQYNLMEYHVMEAINYSFVNGSSTAGAEHIGKNKAFEGTMAEKAGHECFGELDLKTVNTSLF